MIGSGIDPQAMVKQADSMDLIRFKQEMNGLKQRLAGEDADKEKQLRKACQDFEAVFINKLWQGMKSTVPKEGYLHSKQEDQYMSMFDREFAEKMSQAGGIGLADMIYDQLSEKLKETSRDALSGTVQIKPLEAQPIELNKIKDPIALNMNEGDTTLAKGQGMTLEEWGGSESSTNGNVDSVAEVASATSGSARQTSAVMTDVEVKAQLDQLARRLEAERIKGELLATQPGHGGKSYERETADEIGRKLAEIG